MNRLIRDKIVLLLGAAFLGYYLGLSVLHETIMNCFKSVLPPIINDWNLPEAYAGLMGAVIALIIAYIIITGWVERKSFKTGKKSYLIALCSLILMPILISGIFYLQVVSFVHKTESIIPESIKIYEIDAGVSFETSPCLSIVIGKIIEVEAADREKMRQLISQMKLIDVEAEQSMKNTEYTISLYYGPDENWYSKRLNYGQGSFKEYVTGNRIAYYENKELEKEVADIISRSSQISYYNEAEFKNFQNYANRNKGFIIRGKDFEKLSNFIRDDNCVEPDPILKARFQEIGSRSGSIKENETNIFVIELYGPKEENRRCESSYSRDFMIYDSSSNTIMFEGKFYAADLTEFMQDY